MRIMRIANTLAGLLLAAVALSGHAACRSEFEVCAAGSPWLLATTATLRVEFAGAGEQASFAFSFPSPNNVAIDREHQVRDKTTTGRVLLVDGRIMLTKDVELEKGREIYALDGPLLFYQLAMSLLAAAFPEGPDDIKRRSIVDLEEGKRGIAVETSSAAGYFGAPWSLKGSVNRTGPHSIAYDFDFEFSAEGAQRGLAMSGVWRSDPASTPDPAMSLKDWNAFKLEPRTIRQGGTTRRGFDAVATAPVQDTFGGLQNALRSGMTQRRAGDAGARGGTAKSP